jgi:uncharacterized protein YoxC
MNTRAVYAGFGVLAVAIVALALFTIVRSNDLSSRISDLNKTATTLQEEATGESKAALEKQAAKLEEQEETLLQQTRKLKRLEACMPEVQTEVNSMELERFGSEYYVSPSAQVSSYCSDVVYGTGGE